LLSIRAITHSNHASEGGERLVKKLLVLISLIISLALFSSCSTAQGAAKDLGKAAAVISQGVKKAKDAITSSYEEKKEEIEQKDKAKKEVVE